MTGVGLGEDFWPVGSEPGSGHGGSGSGHGGSSARPSRGEPNAGSGHGSWAAAVPGALAVMAAAAAVAVAASASPWLRAYQISGTRAYLWTAAGASVLLSMATTRVARQRPAVAYAVSLLGLVMVSLALTGLHPGRFWHGLTRGPALLVSETLPLAGHHAMLAAPLVFTWVCGAATSELLWRVRPSPVGLGVPVLGFIVAYAITTSAPGDDVFAGSVLLAAVAVAAVAAHRQTEHEGVALDAPEADEALPRRQGRAWVAAAAGAVALAVVLGVVVPKLPGVGTNPALVARTPTAGSPMLVNPVAQVASLRETTAHPATLLTVHTSGPSTGYLGLATLDNYDGGSWTFDTTFHPTGGRVPALPSDVPGYMPGESTGLLKQRYTLRHGYPFQLVPMADRPTQVRGFDAAVDDATGMVVPATGFRLPLKYEVTSQAPAAELATVPRADGIGVVAGGRLTRSSAADLALPPNSSTELAAAVTYIVGLTHAQPAPTVAFLQDALAALRATGYEYVPSPSEPTVGTGLSEVINRIKKAATPEQWATMYAMLARELGVPARIVTGFRIPPPAGAGGLVPAGTYSLTAKQAWTWVEIPVSGIGWVVADPTPSRTSSAQPESSGVSASTIPGPSGQAKAVPGIQVGHPLAPRASIPVGSSGPGPAWWVWGLLALGGVVVVAALLPAVAALRRWSRRRIRRSDDPDELAVGAWLELLDNLERAGLRTAESATTSQIVAESGNSFGEKVAPQVAAVGAVADRAVFATSGVDPPSAEGAWQLQEAARRELFGRLDHRQLARAAVTVGHHPRRPRRK